MRILDELKSKKVLILGFGKEGISSLRWLRNLFPEKPIGIADQLGLQQLSPLALEIISGTKNITLHLGPDYLKAISNYEVIIKSPGIPPFLTRPYLNPEQIITSQTEIFFQECQAQNIGVTGTKGKSTTCALIFDILATAHKKVHLVGNIGRPPLDVLLNVKLDDWVVQELSCHQLIDLNSSPHIAVLLAITPDHLDYYGNFKEYVKAKANITLHQKPEDYLIFDQECPVVREIAAKSKAKKIELDVAKTQILIPAGAPFQLSRLYIKNCAAALACASILNIDSEVVREAFLNFVPLEHRLEYVGQFQEIEFYNDSAASAPSATIGAIKTFEGKIGSLIVGGFERGVDFTPLAEAIWKADIPVLILFPESGLRLWETLLKIQPKNKGLPKTFAVQKMQDAVILAFQHTPKGKICLLSPASPSFGMFRDYKERGQVFKKMVLYYGKKANF